MMDVRKFAWLSARRRLRLVADLQDRVEHWIRDWSLHATCVCVSDGIGEQPQWQLGHARSDALVGVAFDASVLTRLGAHFAQVHDAGDSPLARDIGNEAVRDLAVRVLDADGAAEARAANPSVFIPDTFDPRHGACSLTIGIGDIELFVAMNGPAVDALVPPEPSPLGDLARRGDALAASDVGLELVLPLGDFTIQEVLSLNCGDVLLSEATLDTPFGLSADGSNLGLRCRLARVGDHKAAYIDEPEVNA